MGEAADRTLRALEEGGKLYPHLDPVFSLYRALRQAQLAVESELARDSYPPADGSRLKRGEPLLTFDSLGVEPEALARLAGRIEPIIAERSAFEGRATDEPVDWMAEARKWFESRLPPAGAGGSESSLTRIVAAYALMPWLEGAAESYADRVDLSHWNRTYCPMCGGYADLAFLARQTGQRLLVCSRCSTRWPYRRTGCPYCSSVEQRSQYYPGFDESDRLYVCDRCRAYLKTVDLRERAAPSSVLFERVRLVQLDLAAEKAGYHAGWCVPQED